MPPTRLPVADFVTKIVIAALTGVLGYLAYLVAQRQANTASAKLKLDLFDRRYAVYLSLTEFINDRQGRVVPDDEFTSHVRKLDQAQFLFDREVNDWLLELRKKARGMNNARRVSSETRQEGRETTRHAEIMEASKTYSQLTVDFDKELERTGPMFARYLDFSKNL